MAVLTYKTADKTVATIVDRNAIVKRPDGLTVTVQDATADTRAGAGWALYKWNVQRNSWMLLSKEVADTLTFAEEEKTINNDVVQADFVPRNRLVWDVWVTQPDGAVIDIKPLVSVTGEISVADCVVNPGQFDGYKIHYTYCYGQTASQISDATYSRTDIDQMLGALRTELVDMIDAVSSGTL